MIITIQLTKNGETLGIGVFKKKCANLSSFTVVTDNLKYQSLNGVLYTKPESRSAEITLIAYPMNTGSRIYNIDSFTTEIAVYVFYNNQTLTFIELNE